MSFCVAPTWCSNNSEICPGMKNLISIPRYFEKQGTAMEKADYVKLHITHYCYISVSYLLKEEEEDSFRIHQASFLFHRFVSRYRVSHCRFPDTYVRPSSVTYTQIYWWQQQKWQQPTSVWCLRSSACCDIVSISIRYPPYWFLMYYRYYMGTMITLFPY